MQATEAQIDGRAHGGYEGIAGMLAALDPEQTRAAILPDGPAQIIAPAGSGKTTTLIARLGVLLARGVEPASILVVTFNREAALSSPPGSPAGDAAGRHAAEIEVRTLHALARQVLMDPGAPAPCRRSRATPSCSRRRCSSVGRGRSPAPGCGIARHLALCLEGRGAAATLRGWAGARSVRRTAGGPACIRLRRPRGGRGGSPGLEPPPAPALAIPLHACLRRRVSRRRCGAASSRPAACRARGQPVRGRR